MNLWPDSFLQMSFIWGSGNSSTLKNWNVSIWQKLQTVRQNYFAFFKLQTSRQFLSLQELANGSTLFLSNVSTISWLLILNKIWLCNCSRFSSSYIVPFLNSSLSSLWSFISFSFFCSLLFILSSFLPPPSFLLPLLLFSCWNYSEHGHWTLLWQ